MFSPLFLINVKTIVLFRHWLIVLFCVYTSLYYLAAGSVLLNDELSNGQMANGDVAINMDLVDKQRYQQQLQLIDEQVL